jgi:hypothetical protein
MSFIVRLAFAASLLTLYGPAAGKGYRTDGNCGGLPRVALQTPPGSEDHNGTLLRLARTDGAAR